jgi:hypothetical protein
MGAETGYPRRGSSAAVRQALQAHFRLPVHEAAAKNIATPGVRKSRLKARVIKRRNAARSQKPMEKWEACFPSHKARATMRRLRSRSAVSHRSLHPSSFIRPGAKPTIIEVRMQCTAHNPEAAKPKRFQREKGRVDSIRTAIVLRS